MSWGHISCSPLTHASCLQPQLIPPRPHLLITALTCGDKRISLILAEQVASTPAAMERQGYGAYEGQSGAARAESMQMDVMAAAAKLFLRLHRRLNQ